MLLKEDVNRFKSMSSEDEDTFLESNEYMSLCESDKRKILEIFSSKIDLSDNNFDEFAEEVLVQERIFDLGIDLNEDNYRKIRDELRERIEN